MLLNTYRRPIEKILRCGVIQDLKFFLNIPTLVCEGRRARHAAYTSSFFFLAAAVDIRVNNPTVNVGIQQLNNNAVVWLHLRMPLAQGQDPKCDIPGVTAYGTVTDPAISLFHIRMSSINRTRNLKEKFRRGTWKRVWWGRNFVRNWIHKMCVAVWCTNRNNIYSRKRILSGKNSDVKGSAWSRKPSQAEPG